MDNYQRGNSFVAPSLVRRRSHTKCCPQCNKTSKHDDSWWRCEHADCDMGLICGECTGVHCAYFDEVYCHTCRATYTLFKDQGWATEGGEVTDEEEWNSP